MYMYVSRDSPVLDGARNVIDSPINFLQDSIHVHVESLNIVFNRLYKVLEPNTFLEWGGGGGGGGGGGRENIQLFIGEIKQFLSLTNIICMIACICVNNP